MAATATTSSYSPAFSRQQAGYGLAYGARTQAQAGPSSKPHQQALPQAASGGGALYGTYAPPPSSFQHQGSKGKGRGVENGNGGWDGLQYQATARREAIDPFSRDVGADVGYGNSHGGDGTSASGHGHTQESYYGDERYERGRAATRDRGWSGSSKYSEPAGTFSFPHMHIDVPGGEIGASPVPARRAQQQQPYQSQGHHRQTSAGAGSVSGHGHGYPDLADRGGAQLHANGPVSPRESLASFWTFGRGTARRGQGQQAVANMQGSVGPGPIGGRSSVETQQSRATGSSRQTAMGSGAMRDRSATLGSRSGAVVSTVEASGSQYARPRANTTAPLATSASVPARLSPPQMQPQIKQLQTSQSQYLQSPYHDPSSSSEGGHNISPSYQRHPYAQVLPPIGHREHSQAMPPSSKRSSLLNLTLNVPFLSSSRSLANIRDSANRLKASVSTPNLRQGANGSARSGNGSAPKTPSTATSSKWLSAETWCDALLFPRPRFRMRTAAHVISPPDSPTREREAARAQGPPHSAPLPDTRTLKKSVTERKQEGEGYFKHQDPGPSNQNKIGTSSSAHPAATAAGEAPKNNTPRPLRPKSFAQDDLALLSPVPSLNTVLKQNADFNKEREQWKNAAAHSFQNKRSRSFSRSHTKAKAMLAARLADDQSELVTSFDIIATSAFHGSQALKPNVTSVNTSSGARSIGHSTGLNTTSTHSRKSSGASNGAAIRGHARKESWGKTALKTAKSTAVGAAGLCKFTEDMSPADEKFIALDEEANRQQQARAGEHSGYGRGVQAQYDDSGVLLIAPNAAYQPHLSAAHPHGAKATSPVPSSQSGDSGTAQSGVGIAVSTPSAMNAPTTQDEAFAFAFTAHPFASPLQSKRRPGVTDLPRPSDYAGPHPSRLPENVYHDDAAQDMAHRHRMPAGAAAFASGRTTSSSSPPPATSTHPYAAVQSQVPSRSMYLTVPTSNDAGRASPIAPQKSMFAEVGGSGTVREVTSDEFQYSPYSARHPGISPGWNSDALGVEEALSVALSRSSADSSVLMRDELEARARDRGLVHNVDVNDIGDRVGNGDSSDTTSTARRDHVQNNFAATLPRHPYRSEPMPQISELSTRESWPAAPHFDHTSEGNTSRGGTSNSRGLSVPQRTNSHPLMLPTSAGTTRTEPHSTTHHSHSPGQVSINSSPMTSPRQIRKFDDTEDYSDLFYRPAQAALPPPADLHNTDVDTDAARATERARQDDRIISPPPPLVRTDSGSALTNLQRQLSQSYGRVDGERRFAHDGYNDRMRELHDDDESLLSSAPKNASPPGAALPLRMPWSRTVSSDPQHLIPEDVESERASSMLGRAETEDGTEIFYRLGEVPSLPTPDPVTKPQEQRSSAHGSYFGERGDDTRTAAAAELGRSFRHDGYGDDEDIVLMNHIGVQPEPRRSLALPTPGPLSAAPTSTSDATRASYLTSTSGTSRMSNLSDFPNPPTQATLTPGRILDSYFSSPGAEGTERADPLAAATAASDVRDVQREMEREREREARRSRRTTFGPIEEDSDRDL